jgi:hypothetical protein
LLDQLQQHAIEQQVGHFVPVSDRVQALHGQVVGVVARLARLSRPRDQRVTQALAHFLLLFVEHLLRHLLPGEAQVARHRDHPQADVASG